MAWKGGTFVAHLILVLCLLEDDDARLLGVQRVVVSEADAGTRMELQVAAARWSHDELHPSARSSDWG